MAQQTYFSELSLLLDGQEIGVVTQGGSMRIRKECMDGLTLGHYCGNDYAAAKRDFATRAGLVPEEKQFTTEQLIEIYHCCADAIQRDYGLTYEREQRIEEVQSQITELLPDYTERLKAALEQDASQQPAM